MEKAGQPEERMKKGNLIPILIAALVILGLVAIFIFVSFMDTVRDLH